MTSDVCELGCRARTMSIEKMIAWNEVECMHQRHAKSTVLSNTHCNGGNGVEEDEERVRPDRVRDDEDEQVCTVDPSCGSRYLLANCRTWYMRYRDTDRIV